MRNFTLMAVLLSSGMVLQFGCPTPPVINPNQPELLGSLSLSEMAVAMTIDQDRDRVLITEEDRVRAVDLTSRSFLANVLAGTLESGSDPDAIAILTDGGVVATSNGHMTRMSTALAQVDSLTVGGFEDFDPVVVNSTTGLVYTIGGLSGIVYEIDPSDMSILREISLRDPATSYSTTFTPHMDIDSQTNRLFVRDPAALFVVDLSQSAENVVSSVPLDYVPEGVVVDSDRRLLIINQLFGSTPHASIQVLDLDDFSLLAERSLGNQIHWITLDAEQGRVVANVRVTTAYQTEVMLLTLPNLTPVSYGLILDGEIGLETIYALLEVNTVRNQLLVARDGETARLEFYELP